MMNEFAYAAHSPASAKHGFLHYFKEWQNFPLSVFFSGRTLDFRGEKNRDRLCKTLGIKRENLIIPEQQHSGSVEVVEYRNFRKKILCDGLITKEENLGLAVLTADCLPIFLYDPLIPAIGIVHAGWRSTKEGIARNCILLMQEEFAVQPSDLKVAFGPGIRQCCYEVKEDLLDYFPAHILKKDNCFFLNLLEANSEQLFSLGVREENVVDSGICSSCRNDEFFSYRREGEAAGRTVSVIMLK